MVDSLLEKSSVENSMFREQLFATIICQFDELSLTSLDCLQIDSEDFFLFAEINQILLKIYFILFPFPFMQFMYISSCTLLYQKTKL